MADSLDDRIKYEEKAKGLSDRDLSEFAFVELCMMSERVETINGYVGTLWGFRQKWIGAGKLLGLVAIVIAVIGGVVRMWPG